MYKEPQRYEPSKPPLTGISKASTVEEIADFWDEQDLDAYWDETEEVAFEVRARKRRQVTLAPEIYEGIVAKAKAVGLLAETLINLWLAERLEREKAA